MNKSTVFLLLLSLTLLSCNSAQATPTRDPVLISTLPVRISTELNGLVDLRIVSTPQATVPMSAHGRAIIRACEAKSYSEDSSVCYLGVLDMERQQLMRLITLDAQRKCASVFWSPDGKQFAYHTHYCGPQIAFMWGHDIMIFTAEGNLQKTLWMKEVRWSQDGRYFFATTCRAPNMSPSYTKVVYDTLSWQEVCTFGAAETTPFPQCFTGIKGNCNLLLADGSTISYKSGNKGAVVQICQNSSGSTLDCPDLIPPDTNAYGTKSESEQYRAFVESHVLHIIDKSTDSESEYAIPGWYITTVSWMPDLEKTP